MIDGETVPRDSPAALPLKMTVPFPSAKLFPRESKLSCGGPLVRPAGMVTVKSPTGSLGPVWVALDWDDGLRSESPSAVSPKLCR